jgi:hypothetical protein
MAGGGPRIRKESPADRAALLHESRDASNLVLQRWLGNWASHRLMQAEL